MEEEEEEREGGEFGKRAVMCKVRPVLDLAFDL